MSPTPADTPSRDGSAPVTPLSPARRRGRRVLLGAYYGMVAAIAIASTVEITKQVFFVPVLPSPYASCHDGLRALTAAVARARRGAAGEGGEDATLARFRSALEPDWRYRDSVAESCRGSERDQAALDAIERLRYAEEHAVRREAGDLAPLRRKVQAIVETDLAALPDPTAAP